jgi:O-succinylbenzoate-CoA ligase
MQNNVGLFLTKRAFLSPDREAYVDGDLDLRLSFAELNARSNQLCNAFLASGIEKGDRVALLLMNSAEFVEAFFAMAKIGAVVVPLNWRLVPDELEFILKNAGAKRIIFGEEFLGSVTELHSRGDKTDLQQWLQVEDELAIAPFAESYQRFRDAAADDEPATGAADDDMLYIMYTSGTTGLPKGVVHTHATVTWALMTMGATINYEDGDRFLGALPLFHVGALSPLTMNVYRGITSVVMRSFDPSRAWQLIQDEKITVGLMVPAMLNFMLQVPNRPDFDYSSLRWMLTGAAPVPLSLLEAYEELGIGILQIYGLTETCGPACLMDAENATRKAGSTGRAFFHTDVRIVDEKGNDCPPDVAGEVLVRGGHVMTEYWNNPEATAKTVVDGWLHTGDIAFMDDEGFVTIADRIKDMIISGGENVYPAEIEAALMTHSDVVEAAVIGQKSEKWGESPLALVVASSEGLTEEAVLAHCKTKLAAFKRPKAVSFVDSIPRNPSGKILKRVLREQYPADADE